MTHKLRQSPLDEFSSKIVRFHRLPHGTELRLYRKRDRRRVRSDFTVKRRLINPNTMHPLEGDQTANDLINSAIKLLSTDIEARGLKMDLYRPDGQRINGNTRLRSVRALVPKPSEKDDDQMLELFLTILENAGLDEITLRQASALYWELRSLLGETLDQALLTNEARVRRRNL